MTFEDCGDLGEGIEVFLDAFARAAADPAIIAKALKSLADASEPASRPAGDFFASLGDRLTAALLAGPTFAATLIGGLECQGHDAQRIALRVAQLATAEARKSVTRRMGSGALFGIHAVRRRAQELKLAALLDAGASLPTALSIMCISRATGYRTLARLRDWEVSK